MLRCRFGPSFQIADLDVGLLFILAISSLGIYGIVLGGWASNSHYSLLGALRSAAQLVSYETAAGLALVSGLLLGGTLSMKGLVEAQDSQGVWFIFIAPFSFFIYLIASIAETNRAPFDLPEAESELVAGYMTEYSGFRWSLYFLAEYANMIVVSGIAVTLFLGGWMRPLSGVHAHIFGLPYELLDLLPALIFFGLAAWCTKLALRQGEQIQKIVMFLFVGLFVVLGAVMAWSLTSPSLMPGIHGAFWFIVKVLVYLYGFLWFRFTFPRYRFDQLMKLGWQFLIPLALVNLVMIGIAIVLVQQFGWPLAFAMIAANVVTLLVAFWLVRQGDKPAIAVLPAEDELPANGTVIKSDDARFHSLLFLRGDRGGDRDADGHAPQRGAWRHLSDHDPPRHRRYFPAQSAGRIFVLSQIILYVGGIMVLFIFVIMLVNLESCAREI